MASKEAKQRERSGHPLQCPVCGGDRFWLREAQLNTKAMSFFDLEWFNPSGDCYICENCRHILWFYREGETP